MAGFNNGRFSSTSMFKNTGTMRTIDKKTGNVRAMTNDERVKKLMSDKMSAMHEHIAAGAGSGTGMMKKLKFSLFGTPEMMKNEANKKNNKNSKQLLDKLGTAFAKRQAEKERKRVEVKKQYFGGLYSGRIEEDGRILNANNEVVATVNLKNGKIMNKMGLCIGKYKPTSGATELNISRIIANSMTRGKAAAASAWDPVTGGMGGGSSSGGSIYGNSGNFWGNNNNDSGNGWW